MLTITRYWWRFLLGALLVTAIALFIHWLRTPACRLTPPLGREMPLIFIGGVPRSGTTLMRVMLDAHHSVRCGQETRVIPLFLNIHSNEIEYDDEVKRLEQAGVTKPVFDNAMAAFILQVILGHGEPAARLCSKDPYVLVHVKYMHELFPNGKFLLMVRDGRATVHSIITRNVTAPGYNLSYRDSLQRWNYDMQYMWAQCVQVGPEHCMAVRYETLVLEPKRTLERVLKWLDLPWSDAVLHHERYILKSHGAQLSDMELSNDQVVQPVKSEALNRWVGTVPYDVLADMSQLAPMLDTLGYDPQDNQPHYREMKGLSDGRVE